MAKVHSTFTTKKGTKFDLLDFRGKPYLQVAHRLAWFVEENPFYDISTDIVRLEDDEVLMKAVITILSAEGKMVRRAFALKGENKKNFSDFVEKAETGAIGRALAMLGYGTQYTGNELEEGERLADSPISQAVKSGSSGVSASKKKASVSSIRPSSSLKGRSASSSTSKGKSSSVPTSNAEDFEL